MTVSNENSLQAGRALQATQPVTQGLVGSRRVINPVQARSREQYRFDGSVNMALL